MPQYSADFVPLRWLSKSAQQLLGHHFVVAVAPPGWANLAKSPSYTALFYPQDDRTWIGSAVNAALGNVRQLPSQEFVYFSIRDMHNAHREQIDLPIRACDIHVSNRLPPNWIKFGYDALLQILQPPADLASSTYSYLKARHPTVTLTRLPARACYPYPGTNAAAHHSQRPKR